MNPERLVDENEWTDFSNPLNEKAIQFMMEHFGFPNIDHLSDDECMDLVSELSVIEGEGHHEAEKGIDREKHEPWVRRPLSEYTLMIAGMIVYIGEQFHKGGKRYNPEDPMFPHAE